MPGDDRLRFDNDESRAPFGPEAEEPDPEESVPGSKFGPTGNGTSQDDDLVSQGEDLGLERKARSKAGEDG
jgi:hypothetical protein